MNNLLKRGLHISRKTPAILLALHIEETPSVILRMPSLVLSGKFVTLSFNKFSFLIQSSINFKIMKTSKRILLFCIVCSFILFGCKKNCDNPCVVKKENLKMSGKQEVPARESNASGNITISYNKCENILKYTVTWKNLTGAPVGAHIHGPAARGVNASIKHDFAALIPKTTSGTFTNEVKVDGIAIVEDSLLQGLYYINIHTPKFPGGEIRGQLEF